MVLKKIIRIKNDIFYSPSHNTFFRLEPSAEIDFSNFLLEISGHEEKIFEFLICNYNNYVTKETLENEFPECSDPYDKTLDRLRRDKIEGKLKLYELIKKNHGKVIMYLSESPFISETSVKKSEVPLLCRNSYYVNYDKILWDFESEKDGHDPDPLLQKWISDCEKADHYDEKCLLLLERMGFLPAFGNKSVKLQFLKKSKEIIYKFEESDINEYGGTELLIYTRNVLLGIIEYIEAQLQIILSGASNDDLKHSLKQMLNRFQMISPPENTSINPLIITAFYHYYGLILYRNYLINGSSEMLSEAFKATETALESAKKVDMHLQIWSAFLTYDLARICSELGDYDKAIHNINIAVLLREGLTECPFFSDKMKTDLLFEYYLARIIQTEIELKSGKITYIESQDNYRSILNEIQNICSFDNDSWEYLFRILKIRINE